MLCIKLLRYQIKTSYTLWKSTAMFVAGQNSDFSNCLFREQINKTLVIQTTRSFHCSAVFQLSDTKGYNRMSELRRLTWHNLRNVGQKGPLQVT